MFASEKWPRVNGFYTYTGGFNASSHLMFACHWNCFFNVCILLIETSLVYMHNNNGWILFISVRKRTISWNVRSNWGENGVQRIANSILSERYIAFSFLAFATRITSTTFFIIPYTFVAFQQILTCLSQWCFGQYWKAASKVIKRKICKIRQCSFKAHRYNNIQIYREKTN